MKEIGGKLMLVTADQIVAHLVGDYLLQSDWMAQNKTKDFWIAFIHALAYGTCFVPLAWPLARPRFGIALAVIIFTHAVIDRFRLARYVVWAKNWLGPCKRMVFGTLTAAGKSEAKWWAAERRPIYDWHNFRLAPIEPLRDCPTGYPPSTPPWLAVWLLIIADNTLHILINALALKYF